ncbi:MAG TPA: phosphate signaling complex protein PhoU [Candidatus Lachnoclostridium stercoripullorum]|uniref:Phosphate-specific transport system accessory protein PhoU n=1 Tax=Candidatus Lachnoclostridium stercoripullorum TaxID=2838635 RepID=A0A9D2AWD3_9FIRM|nr:phosphate signaling complex protein PhoU [Candidatus Lachnoclostridium stercoripullorum]
MEDAKTMRITFEQELENLNESLTEMGTKVEKIIERTFEAFGKNDRDALQKIIGGDGDVDRMEKDIEAKCLSLMLRQQPVAKDLRHISMALKVVTDLERIGDHAVDIAELAMRLDQKDAQSMIEYLPEMVENVKTMLRESINAFVKKDRELARSMEERDDVIDGLFNRVKQEAVKLLKEDGAESDKVVDLLMLAKYLERIGDHAVNVCEWTEFFDTGLVKNVRIL